ncbi:MAG: hypothetical protein R2748_28340 [Bryobacterales bacterium]
MNGESVLLQGNSPVQGQKELIWMVAAMRPEGLFHLLMISPQNEYNQYSKTFEEVVRSVKFGDKYKGRYRDDDFVFVDGEPGRLEFRLVVAAGNRLRRVPWRGL